MSIKSQTFTTELDSYTILFDSEESIKKPLTILSSYELLSILKEAYPLIPKEVKQWIDQL